MQGYFPQQECCKNCGAELKQKRTGRPGEYCGTTCRQAAHRKRQQRGRLDTAALDAELTVCAATLEADVRHLVRALEEPYAPGEAGPLTTLVRIQQQVEKMLPGAVGRARRRGVSWARIGAVLSLNKDTVRRKYGDVDRLVQRMALPRRPASPAPVPALNRGPGHDDSDADAHRTRIPAAVPERAPTDVPAPTGLAPVLSHLQRASKLSLRILGERTSLSASHLSRILSGERFPDWPVTARIARACGADPCALRKVWEDAETHRADKRHKEHTLDSALRYLHHRAGEPSTWSMAVASSGTLDQDEISAVLDGTTVPDWDVVCRLVLVLDGEPTFFEPLWETAFHRATEQPPPPITRQPPAPPRRTATHLEELLRAYSSALSSTAPLLPAPAGTAAAPRPSPFLLRRHPMPAPIPALAHWGDALPT
ncbi:helix-turn-helix domain-containing protein [Streptomyces sp. NPDC050355]|uniref:helix-turn-helix domain-containing protein n=1 Tax=Streptomyces sp. NPDC050355 TaxID=3365609 RepID=UPI0037A63264